MALKDWKKIKEMKWENLTILRHKLKIEEHFYNNQLTYKIYLLKPFSAWDMRKKPFLTKLTALKYAKAYMRTH